MLKIIIERYSQMNGKKSLIRAWGNFYFSLGFRVSCYTQRIINTKSNILKRIRIKNLEKKYGIKIGIRTQIGKGLVIHHPNGIVIGDDVVIGKNCNIYQQVTIGQKDGIYPVIKDNVTLYTGSKIIGKVTVNNNAVVAPNTVVVKDVPENAVVSGVPAQIIGWRKK